MDKYTNVQLGNDKSSLWTYNTETGQWVNYDPCAPKNQISAELAVALAKNAGIYEEWKTNAPCWPP